VCLQAEPPLRMVETVAQGERGVLTHGRTIHGLQVEALEVKILEEVRRRGLVAGAACTRVGSPSSPNRLRNLYQSKGGASEEAQRRDRSVCGK
jgi:hypothetical protein